MLDFVGEMEDIIGAMKGTTRQRGGVQGKLATLPAWWNRTSQMTQAIPTAPQVAEGPAGVPRKLPLPLPLTSVPAGGTVTITQRAQIPQRAERLVLTSSSNPSSSVQVQAFVGVFPQTVAAGFIPLDIFRATAYDVMLQGNTLQVGNDFSLQTQNIGALAETVGGAVIGMALQP